MSIIFNVCTWTFFEVLFIKEENRKHPQIQEHYDINYVRHTQWNNKQTLKLGLYYTDYENIYLLTR